MKETINIDSVKSLLDDINVVDEHKGNKMKHNERSLAESIKSLRETMTILEAGDYTAPNALKAIGGSEHPMQNFSDKMNAGKDNVNNAIGDLASGIGHSIADPLKQGIPIAKEIGRGIGEVGKGAYNNIADHVHDTFTQDAKDWGIDRFGGGVNDMPSMKKSSVGPGDAPDIANSMLDAPHPYSAPAPNMHQFNPSDTSYSQDHPSSFIPPEDKDGGLSDLDKAPAYKEPHAAASHPAGKPKTPGAKFDPAIQKMQYELRAKGYPVKADGILGPETQAAIDWERQSQETQGRIQGYDELKADMDQSIAPPEPFDNTQGEFDRQPELNEHVSFDQDDILARIIQLARG